MSKEIYLKYHLSVHHHVKERRIGIREGLLRYRRLAEVVCGRHWPPSRLEAPRESNPSPQQQ